MCFCALYVCLCVDQYVSLKHDYWSGKKYITLNFSNAQIDFQNLKC